MQSHDAMERFVYEEAKRFLSSQKHKDAMKQLNKIEQETTSNLVKRLVTNRLKTQRKIEKAIEALDVLIEMDDYLAAGWAVEFSKNVNILWKYRIVFMQ